MKKVFGDTSSFSASERIELEKLADKRSNREQVVSPDLLKRAARITARLGVQIGLILGRDGRVTHVVVGTRDRLYLPDLGRYRLDRARLRSLRLIVLVPDGDRILERYARTHLADPSSSTSYDAAGMQTGERSVLAPRIAPDLITDLEKLRFDALLVVSVMGGDSRPGPVSLAHLEPLGSSSPFAREKRNDAVRGIAFQHASQISDIKIDFERFIEDLEARLTASFSREVDTDLESAVLVGAYCGTLAEAQASMAELQELVRTAGLRIADTIVQRRKTLDPRTVIGRGKVEDVVLRCLDRGADLLIFDRELTPGQLRSITNLTELRVIDRSMLILDVFAQRAKTSEGRLQVELAQLKYSLPRLTERDTGLSRLTGGIGGRGPGETKLEISRRRARDRITLLERKIDKLSQQRGLRRERRQSRGIPVIAIVGYTNAGKSTLLNALTKGDVFVEGKLFATLDPATRRMRFPNDHEVVFVDTVGFIRELPKELVAAFRATLEEVHEADVLVHVVDAANPDFEKQMQVVESTLDSLGFGEKPRLLVWNKIDLLSQLERQTLLHRYPGLPVSAVERTGFMELLYGLQDLLAQSFVGIDPSGFISSGATLR